VQNLWKNTWKNREKSLPGGFVGFIVGKVTAYPYIFNFAGSPLWKNQAIGTVCYFSISIDLWKFLTYQHSHYLNKFL